MAIHNTGGNAAKVTGIHFPTLVMVRGLPGSGKSHVSTELQKAIGSEHVLLLAPDPDTMDSADRDYLAFSEQLSREGVDKSIHQFRWLRKRACDAIVARKIVVWSQPFTNEGIFNRLVAFLQAHASEHGIRLPVLLVEVDIDHVVAKARVAKRKQAGGHGPTDSTFGRHVGDYTSYADQGYPTVTVHGEDDIAASVAAVVKKLEGLSGHSS